MDTNDQKELMSFLENEGMAPVTVPKRNYWFLRTQGGDYFEEFFFNGYVAIGWNDVPCIAPIDRTDESIGPIKDIYDRNATRALNNVYKFCKEMKKGDIVVIPSTKSANFAFGELTEDSYYEENVSDPEALDDGVCPYIKRRAIKWMASANKALVDSKLYLFFRNQQALSNANEYKEYIERAINPFYILDGVAHFNIAIQTQKPIPGIYIPSLIFGLLERTANNINSNIRELSNKVNTKINVQSPGIVEFFGDPTAVLMIATIGIILFGGKLKISHTKGKTEGEMSTEGLSGLILKLSGKNKKSTVVDDSTLKEIESDLDIKLPKKID